MREVGIVDCKGTGRGGNRSKKGVNQRQRFLSWSHNPTGACKFLPRRSPARPTASATHRQSPSCTLRIPGSPSASRRAIRPPLSPPVRGTPLFGRRALASLAHRHQNAVTQTKTNGNESFPYPHSDHEDKLRFSSRSDNHAFPGALFRTRPRSHLRVDRL
ncbi:hypothetical protein E2C01_051005 [Portunus trituberculatus]|uniref:Uncharacterized protein n=1 Tax=Portunus trituberculatus TaxID=210409 RepID=A0A5B7GHG3_PORTR|nr:hypothetical protein [Portunus trituberculatus]